MIKKILMIILALAVVATVFAACGDTDTTTTTSLLADATTTTTTKRTTTTRPDYDKIFLDQNVAHTPALFSTPSTAAYALTLTDGTIDVLEYGYDGDIIKEMRETVYLYIGNLTETQKLEVADSMDGAFADAAELSYVTVTSYSTDDYYIVAVRCEGLDNPANVQKLMDLSIIAAASDSTLSMEATDITLTSGGYSKK